MASSLSIAGGSVAQENGVPMITPSRRTRASRGSATDLPVCFLDSFRGYAMAKFATDQLKAKRFAALFDQSAAYSDGPQDDFKAAIDRWAAPL